MLKKLFKFSLANLKKNFFTYSLSTLFFNYFLYFIFLGGKENLFSLTSKVKPTEMTKNGNIKEINSSLEELLKSLNDGDKVYQLNKEDENKNENENHTISQITKK